MRRGEAMSTFVSPLVYLNYDTHDLVQFSLVFSPVFRRARNRL
jgi:hypothetical protein